MSKPKFQPGQRVKVNGTPATVDQPHDEDIREYGSSRAIRAKLGYLCRFDNGTAQYIPEGDIVLDDLRLMRWAADGFPPSTIPRGTGAVRELIEEVQALRSDRATLRRAVAGTLAWFKHLEDWSGVGDPPVEQLKEAFKESRRGYQSPLEERVEVYVRTMVETQLDANKLRGALEHFLGVYLANGVGGAGAKAYSEAMERAKRVLKETGGQ